MTSHKIFLQHFRSVLFQFFTEDLEFFAMIGTMLPAIQFSGLINPISSLEGAGKMIGQIYPATYYYIISRGVFNKALGMANLQAEFVPIIIAAVATLGLSIILLKKQER